MAHGDCDFGAMTVEQLLMATITKNEATGVYYMRTVQTDVDCGNLADVIDCGSKFDLATLLKKIIVVDDCSGKLAINLANCTC